MSLQPALVVFVDHGFSECAGQDFSCFRVGLSLPAMECVVLLKEPLRLISPCNKLHEQLPCLLTYYQHFEGLECE
jgi:hypothetical protein